MTSNGTAMAGSDYMSASGTVTFFPGQTSQTVMVQVTGDTTNESDETFTVTLSMPTNATLQTATGTGTIQNDDGSSPPPPPSLSSGNVSPAEGNSGTTAFNFPVTLSSASTQTVTVNYMTSNGTAMAGSDYMSASGTVTFFPGQTSQTVMVQVTGDTTNESDETFTVTLSMPTNATLQTATGTGTIQNDDVNSAPDAVNDSVTTDEDTSVSISVLGNDTDPNGDSLSISSVDQPAHGAAAINGTDVTYTPTADFSGTDSFNYTISDGHGGSDSATVTVTVSAVNDPPVGNADSVTVAEDSGSGSRSAHCSR